MKHFEQYDLLEDSNHILWVVLASINNETVLAHPKYILNENDREYYTRISNPVSPERNNFQEFSNALRIGCRDYLVKITSEYKGHRAIPFDINNLPNDAIYSVAKDIFNTIIPIVGSENIGFTGSILLKTAKDNYSDIDVVMTNMGYSLYKENIEKQHYFSRRTTDEWEYFYKKYNISTVLSQQEFAFYQKDKSNQISYKGIDVSIFIRDENPLLLLLSSFNINYGKSVNLIGKCIFAKMDTLPGLIIIENEGKNITILNMHRTYQCLDCFEHIVHVVGTSISNDGLIVVNYNSIDVIRYAE
ncbi:MAG: hypothetical protein LBS55_07385 [Prevotellaceae bacterium]|jgi:predicted nucleotidyltransferase|nr:hypothetical protein [Prevotellaceae bacterium]